MSSSLKTLEDAFIHELQDILYAEQQVMKTLPKMAKKASNSELRQAFEEHVKQTEKQAERIKKAFDSIGHSSRSEKCEGMMGIIKEGQAVMGKDAEPEVMDAELIAAAQKVKHYEIASYGTICEWAQQLGFEEAHHLLGQNLAEEKSADQKLSTIARKYVNAQAGEEFEEEEVE